MRPILAVHLCWGTYGFWLPNDPRGSGSEYVWSEELFEHGPATQVSDRSRSGARRSHDRQNRLAAKEVLKYPAVRFNGIQARAVGCGFAEFARNYEVTVWACAIMPEHVHLVIGPHQVPAREVTRRLKSSATVRLKEEGMHPFGHLARPDGTVPKCWQRGGWVKFLNDPESIRHEIKYVEQNPPKEGKPLQEWSFVSEYPG